MCRLPLGLAGLVLGWFTAPLIAQAPDKKPSQLWFPSPLKMELSQHLNPWDRQGKTGTDRFKLAATVKNVSAQYSTLAPAALGGKQFQSIPGGYKIVEFTVKPKWGLLQGFRSTGFGSRFLPPGSARNLTGAVLELPKSVFAAKLSGYFIHADHPSPATPNSRSAGSQAGITVAKDLGKSLSLATEWTQSWQESEDGMRSRSGRGLFLRVRGNVAKADAIVTLRFQGEGLTNPAMPVRGRERSLFSVDMNRSYKKHQIQYSRHIDSQGEIYALRVPFTASRQDSLRWTYSPKIWPQLSASQMWSLQRTAGSWETEENTRLSVTKSLKRVSLGVAHLRAERNDAVALRPVWLRGALIGDASLEIQKTSRLNFHYESNDFRVLYPASQFVHTETLQSSTRVSLWGGKLALQPAINFYGQQACPGRIQSSLMRIMLSALVKLPSRLVGTATDLLISFNFQHARVPGRGGQDLTGLVVQWNLKRL